MKHALIIAHPKKDSFNAAVALAYQSAATGRGHSVIIRDLYEMHFDPCLQADEIPGPHAYHPRPDVAQERALLHDIDVFAFVYPLWLNTPPAILKGYWDRVFGMGFAYDRKAGANAPLLKGRKMISFTSSGAPIEWVKATGAWNAMQTLFDQHLAAVCGLEVVDHMHFGGIVPGIRKDAVDQRLETVTSLVAAHF